MKTIDLTKPVMEQVVRLERKRTRRWIRIFSVTVAILLIVAALFLVRAALRLSERHTWDLFALLMEDKEIISEFWQDTAMIFFEELPKSSLLIAGAVAVAIALLFVFTAKKRTVVRRKMQELAKREKKQS
ncbi:hypothetical protein HY950_01460 [Candidatus Gottesmanbacteria bacterium]|nr:hypothetical protein [Candidatus Gottesmanbacteria bacterium]